MKCARHGDECAFQAETRRAFDEWVDAQKRSCRGDLTTQQLRDTRAAYDRAREDMIRECEGIQVGAP
jgi:hypothetical protein